MNTSWSKRDQDAFLADADREALYLVRNRTFSTAIELAPELDASTLWPSGNRQGPRGNLGRSVWRSDIKRGVFGPYVEVGADYYAVFLAKAGQIRNHDDFLMDALDASRSALI